jgi:hypothetical protein
MWSRSLARARRRLLRSPRTSGCRVPCLQRWLKLADIEDGRRPGVTASESAKLREITGQPGRFTTPQRGRDTAARRKPPSDHLTVNPG